jgi:hypothetical protein
LFLKGAAAARRRHMDRLAELEGGMLATKRRVEVESEIARLADSARADPDGYDAAEANLRLLLDAAEGLTRPERAQAVRAEAEARLAESMLAGLIERDRLEEAEERLGRDDAPVDAGRKARLQRRLADAHGERAAKQAMQRAGRVLELERRARSGETDEDEIGRAFAAGDIAEARRDGLLALARSAAERREQRRADRAEVAERLASGQAFDPARDRLAVDAYYDALLPSLREAGADDDAFLREATDLVARTGVWPGRFRTFVETQLDAGQHAAIAAKALARLHGMAPATVADVARGDLAFAAAAARLIDAGIADDAALARARPFRGLPGAEDAELRAAQAFELRPHYKDWLEGERGVICTASIPPICRELPDEGPKPVPMPEPPGGDDSDPDHDLPPPRGGSSDEEGDDDKVDDDNVVVAPALLGRFARSFEDWFFRTGDASLSRGLAVQDLRADVRRADTHAAIDQPQPEPLRPGADDGPASVPEPIRPDDKEPGGGLCPDVHRPGWECDGGGFWRPARPDEETPRPEPLGRAEGPGVDLNMQAGAGGDAGDGDEGGDDSRGRRPGVEAGGDGGGGGEPAPGAPAPGDEPRPSEPSKSPSVPPEIPPSPSRSDGSDRPGPDSKDEPPGREGAPERPPLPFEMVPPVENPTVRDDRQGDGRFGATRRRPDGTTYPHEGVDIEVPPGQSVKSPVAGTVEGSSDPYPEGHPLHGKFNTVWIRTEDGHRVGLRYVAPTDPDGNQLVKPGDKVTPGQVIGSAQNRAKEAPGMDNHIHLEIRRGAGRGVSVDPTDWFIGWGVDMQKKPKAGR